MNKIYRFDDSSPPVLNEKMLRALIERRKTQRQTVLLVLAGVLVDICLAFMAIALYPINLYLSIACMCYALFALCAGAAIAAVYSTKTRRNYHG